MQGGALLSCSDLFLLCFSISYVLCCRFTLGSEGYCFTSSAYGFGKALLLCRFCVRHDYFNINPTDDQKNISIDYITWFCM